MAVPPWLAQHVAVTQPPSAGLMPDRAMLALASQFKHSLVQGSKQWWAQFQHQGKMQHVG